MLRFSNRMRLWPACELPLVTGRSWPHAAPSGLVCRWQALGNRFDLATRTPLPTQEVQAGEPPQCPSGNSLPEVSRIVTLRTHLRHPMVRVHRSGADASADVSRVQLQTNRGRNSPSGHARHPRMQRRRSAWACASSLSRDRWTKEERPRARQPAHAAKGA